MYSPARDGNKEARGKLMECRKRKVERSKLSEEMDKQSRQSTSCLPDGYAPAYAKSNASLAGTFPTISTGNKT
jgi:hypothetical protein